MSLEQSTAKPRLARSLLNDYRVRGLIQQERRDCVTGITQVMKRMK